MNNYQQKQKIMKMKFILLTFGLFVLHSNLSVVAQKLPADVEESIKKRLAYGESPSYAIGIIDKNGERYYNFGTKTINGTPVDEHTIYEIGSITKVFTATLLAQNVIDGKMKLDDPIKNYLPQEVKVPTHGTKEITLGNLSDHTSGLPRMPNNFHPANPKNPYADYTLDQLYSFLSGYELTRDVGEQFEYSNLAQGLLGQILARQASMSYENLMVEKIASPLNMDETRITLNEQMKENLAYGYSGGEQVENWDIPTLAGAGAIRSSTSDMLKFLAANLEPTKTPLSEALELTQQVRHNKAGEMRVGLGWMVAKSKNGDGFWHNGGTGGYRTFIGFVKGLNMGVVVLTNSNTGADDIGAHLLDPDKPLKVVKPNLVVEINKIIMNQGVSEAKSFYRNVYLTKPEEYDFVENQMNTLGFKYLTNNNNEAALSIFEFNVDRFPKSYNAYDSYAEACMKDGNTKEAIKNYQRSVELNPRNQNGIDMLKKLGVDISNLSKEVNVDEKILESFVGKYELTPSFILTVRKDGNQLKAQATGQSEFPIFPQSENVFYYKVVVAQLTFNRNGEGIVESLTLHQNGQDITGKKLAD